MGSFTDDSYVAILAKTINGLELSSDSINSEWWFPALHSQPTNRLGLITYGRKSLSRVPRKDNVEILSSSIVWSGFISKELTLKSASCESVLVSAQMALRSENFLIESNHWQKTPSLRVERGVIIVSRTLNEWSLCDCVVYCSNALLTHCCAFMKNDPS